MIKKIDQKMKLFMKNKLPSKMTILLAWRTESWARGIHHLNLNTMTRLNDLYFFAYFTLYKILSNC